MYTEFTGHTVQVNRQLAACQPRKPKRRLPMSVKLTPSRCTATLQDPGYLSAHRCLPPDIDAEESHVRDRCEPKRATIDAPTPSRSDDEAAPSSGLGVTATSSPLRRASRGSERPPCAWTRHPPGRVQSFEETMGVITRDKIRCERLNAAHAKLVSGMSLYATWLHRIRLFDKQTCS
ncbi:hypothetical protein P3T76_004635 [Phytophthora citrophthora]|uniref:Uncharacterized protein n=1 Tax=Phytophthora citrophthora TaxID=4793 RepID=A0AAD9LQL6_9STRA|nr:hypothetical protein P3T76_004630 [Phytophthora citrophthora]KAK1943239.1 hypothetical protein P3T76_004635 [Phytophthora citrophthora]